MRLVRKLGFTRLFSQEDLRANLQELERSFNTNFEATQRVTEVLTTPVIAAGAAWQSSIVLGKGWRIYKIVASSDARVRFYGLVAGQTADAARAFGAGADPGNAVLYDEQYQAGANSLVRYPMLNGASCESSPTSAIPVTVNNLGGSPAAVTLTVIYQTLEF